MMMSVIALSSIFMFSSSESMIAATSPRYISLTDHALCDWLIWLCTEFSACSGVMPPRWIPFTYTPGQNSPSYGVTLSLMVFLSSASFESLIP